MLCPGMCSTSGVSGPTKSSPASWTLELSCHPTWSPVGERPTAAMQVTRCRTQHLKMLVVKCKDLEMLFYDAMKHTSSRSLTGIRRPGIGWACYTIV